MAELNNMDNKSKYNFTMVYVGKFKNADATALRALPEFKNLGCDVIDIDYRNINYKDLSSYIINLNPDVLVIEKGSYELNEMKFIFSNLNITNDILKIYTTNDKMVGFNRIRERELKEVGQLVDCVITSDGSIPSFYNQYKINWEWLGLSSGVENTSQILPYLEPTLSQIGFLGSIYHQDIFRIQMISFLKNKYTFRTNGENGLAHRIWGYDISKFCSSVDIIVGGSYGCHPNYWSNRIYRMIGHGGFVITHYIPGLEKHFIDGKHCIFFEYNNLKDLDEKIQYYLPRKDLREEIRFQGYKHVMKHFNQTEICKQFLDIVSKYLLKKRGQISMDININTRTDTSGTNEQKEIVISTPWYREQGLTTIGKTLIEYFNSKNIKSYILPHNDKIGLPIPTGATILKDDGSIKTIDKSVLYLEKLTNFNINFTGYKIFSPMMEMLSQNLNVYKKIKIDNTLVSFPECRDILKDQCEKFSPILYFVDKNHINNLDNIRERKNVKSFLFISRIDMEDHVYKILKAIPNNVLNKIKITVFFKHYKIKKKIRIHPNITIINNILTNEELKNLYNNHDVACFITRMEGYGLMIDEAIYNGLPVITTPLPPFKNRFNEDIISYVDSYQKIEKRFPSTIPINMYYPKIDEFVKVVTSYVNRDISELSLKCLQWGQNHHTLCQKLWDNVIKNI